MGRIYCVMGKSSSGKDTLFGLLRKEKELSFQTIIPYTTRPMRAEEQNGREYFFCGEAKVKELNRQGKIIELREYHTVQGLWKYFTVDDGQIDLDGQNRYLLIGTLESYLKIRSYFGEKAVVPIYIEVEDGERLKRAIARECQQKKPKYEEMCRRFLADAADFSEEKLKEAGIETRFSNDNLEDTLRNIIHYIREGERLGY